MAKMFDLFQNVLELANLLTQGGMCLFNLGTYELLPNSSIEHL